MFSFTRPSAARIAAFLAAQEGAPFSALVETIVSQQLSTRAADTIFGRVFGEQP